MINFLKYLATLPMWFQLFIITGGLLVAGYVIYTALGSLRKAKSIDISVGPLKADIDIDDKKKEEVSPESQPVVVPKSQN